MYENLSMYMPIVYSNTCTASTAKDSKFARASSDFPEKKEEFLGKDKSGMARAFFPVFPRETISQ